MPGARRTSSMAGGLSRGSSSIGAERVDVAGQGHAARQRGLEGRRAAPGERIVDDRAGLGEPVDEEARQLRLEAGAVRDRAGCARRAGGSSRTRSRMVRSLCIHAVRATFLGFPAVTRR